MKKYIEDDIIQNDPWSSDKLKRRETAEILTKVLETVQHPLVVSVDASFGSGKTYFAKRWHSDLLLQKKVAVYFNAWESDFAGEPLVALLDAIKTGIEGLSLPTTAKIELTEKFGTVVKAAAPSLLKAGVNAGISLLTFGAVRDGVDTVFEAVAKGAIDELESIANRRIEAFRLQKETRQSVKAQLTELRKLVSVVCADAASQNDHNIYILIDELDRCDPRYALDLLESAKHLFDVEGYVFVLFVDQAALQSMAASRFGVPEKGEGYFRKFIDWRFLLPRPDNDVFARYLFDHFKLGEAASADHDLMCGKGVFVKWFAHFASRANLSLRAQTHAFSLVNMSARIQPKRTIAALLVVLCIARESGFPKWSELVRADAPGTDLAEYFGLARNAAFDPRSTSATVESLWIIRFLLDPLPRDSSAETRKHRDDAFASLGQRTGLEADVGRTYLTDHWQLIESAKRFL